MNNLINQLPDQSHKMTHRARNAFWIAGVFVVGSLIATANFLILALQTDAWQWVVFSGMSSLLVVMSAIGIGVIRRGSVELGIKLIIYAYLPVALVGAALVADIGLIMGLGVALIVSAIATQTLSPKGIKQTVIAAIVIGIAMELLSWFGNPYQLVAPQQLIYLLPTLIIGVVIVYGFLVVRQFANYALRTKLIIAFILVSVLSVGTVTFVTTYITRQTLTANANQALLAGASQTAAGLDSFINVNLIAVRTESQLAAFAEYLKLTPDQRQADILARLEVIHTLRSLSLKNPEFIVSYALLNDQGHNEIDTITTNMGLDESDNDYFQIPLKSQLPYVSPVRFEEDGQAYFYFSSPVLRGSNGILRLRYKAAILQHLIEKNTNLTGAQSFPVLLDENYLHLAHGTEPNVNFKLVDLLAPARMAALQAAGRLPNLPINELSTNLPELAQKLDNASTQPSFSATDVATGDKVNQVGVVQLETQPWLVAFFQPQEVFLAPIQAQTQIIFGVVTVIVFLVAAVAFGLGQFLADPIIRLTAVAQQVAAGDLSVRAPVTSKDEIGRLATAFNNMTTQLYGSIGLLEEQVQERTADLTLSMQVGQRAAAIRDLDTLLPTMVNFIREQFDLYLVQIFIVDDLGQTLFLKAATGTAGQELLAAYQTLPVEPGSIIGQAAVENRSIVVSNTATSEMYKFTPLLPDIRSELSVPLVVEGGVIGILDMQDDKINTFTESNLIVFEAMATQLAISIDSARQWTLAQETQQQSEQLVKQLTRESWTDKLSTRREGLGFTYDLLSVTPAETPASNLENGGLSVAVVVQNQPIGQLSVETSSGKSWSKDEQVLLEAVAQQLAQKAENLRLFEVTQQRAAREQITRQITDKIRASRDIETALKTAAEELSKALGTAKAVIDLKMNSANEEEHNMANELSD